MSELKISKGPWHLERQHATNGGHYVEDTIWVSRENGERRIVATIRCGLPETEANAEFLTEAGRVANECGLMPRELLEQRNALMEALRWFLQQQDEDGLMTHIGEHTIEECGICGARAAIARAEGREA